MDIRKLQRAIVDGLEEVKGQNIVVFNTEHLSPLFERVIIASGTSNRQTRALAASVREAVKSKGFGPSRTEGEDNGEWIIVDCGAAVVHLMQPAIRDYYRLEEIWGDKPVRLKIDGTPRRLVKADAAHGKPAAAAPRPGARAAAGAAAPAKRKAAPRKAVSRTVGVKRSAAGSAAANTAAPRKSAAAKTPLKPAVKAAGKTPARSARRKA
jgi:ribosome-associated protein